MSKKSPSKADFEKALHLIGKPSGKQLKFLQAHFSAPGKASTATELACTVKYKSYGGINLHYGLLAKRIGEALGRPDETLSLILEFNRPESLTNAHWILSMKMEFAEALLGAGWVERA
jgi:hypothetical protein